MAIQFVGGNLTTKVGAASGNSTIALNSGLTGGIASSVSTDDLVVAVFATASTADRTLAITDGTNNYTLIGSEVYQNSVFDINMRVAYKFMGATPDTATTFGPTGDAADAGAMAVYVFRGVDKTTPIESQSVGTITSTLIPSFTSAFPVASGAFIIVIGAAAHNGGADTYTQGGDLVDFFTNGQNDTNDVVLGIGHKDNWTSGGFTPTAWTCSQADSGNFSAAQATIVLKPSVSSSFIFDPFPFQHFLVR